MTSSYSSADGASLWAAHPRRGAEIQELQEGATGRRTAPIYSRRLLETIVPARLAWRSEESEWLLKRLAALVGAQPSASRFAASRWRLQKTYSGK